MADEPIPLQPLNAIKTQLLTADQNRAWDIVYDAQDSASSPEETMYARLLGHLLLELCRPTRRESLGDTPSSHLTKEILSTGYSNMTRNKSVYTLGEKYLHHLLRSFRTEQTSYPPRSSHPSRPSFEKIEQQILATLEEQDAMPRDMKCQSYSVSRKITLERDGFRCVLTGIIDQTSADRNKELIEVSQKDRTDTQVLNVCHILNSAAGKDPSKTTNKMGQTAGVLGILEMFGLDDIVNALLHENGVDSPRNLITMLPTHHTQFDRMRIWLEETEMENVYVIDCRPSERFKLELRGFKQQVNLGIPSDTCKLTDAKRIPIIPDRRLLALHAACARVAHMSGAAEFLDQLFWDAEESRVLLSDGSSATMLTALLGPFGSYSDNSAEDFG